MEIFDYENNQIKLGNINDVKGIRTKFWNNLYNIYCKDMRNDLSYSYQDIVNNWNTLACKLLEQNNALDLFECAYDVFDNRDYYTWYSPIVYIRIYVDSNDTVWLIKSDKKLKTANVIYITKKELEEL